MLTIFESLLLGHLVGDYLLQNNWMAQRKGAKLFPCVVHCLIYTVCVCLFTEWKNPLWYGVVFLSHFPIDRFSLADKWGKLIGGRSLTVFMNEGQQGIPTGLTDEQRENYVTLRGAFTALVYTVMDNTIHLLLLVLGAWLVLH